MKTVAVVACLAVLAVSVSALTDTEKSIYQNYLDTYGKVYTSTAEYNEHLNIFYDNLKIIDELNAKNGETAFGINMFTDIHPKDFAATHLNYRPSAKKAALDGVYEATSSYSMPSHFDWRSKGVITPVKNQGQCGSCWAFSATEEIESRWAQAGHKLTELSVQQIVSCDNTDGGCNGGDTVTAYQYVMSAGGLESGAQYPYTSGGGNNGQCQFNERDIVANITGFKWVTKNSDESTMKHFIANTGPISTCVDASTWQFYSGGVVTSNCGNQLDHCVQTVGYNDSGNNGPYWVVRNSWTTGWGEEGYIYIQIGSDLCGIADEPTYVECPEAN